MRRWTLVLILVAVQLMPLLAAEKEPRFARDIARYEEKDKQTPPPKGAIVFVGSSSFTLWKTLETDLAPLVTVNRGFGGSVLADVIDYADRIVIPYEPKAVVIYAGENDIAAHKKPGKAADDFKKLVKKLRKALPEVKLYYISMKPSVKRWAIWDIIQEGNAKIKKEAEKLNVTFIDITQEMLNNGEPRNDIFKPDNLHMNEKGYAIWIPKLKAALGAQQ